MSFPTNNPVCSYALPLPSQSLGFKLADTTAEIGVLQQRYDTMATTLAATTQVKDEAQQEVGNCLYITLFEFQISNFKF